MNLLGPLFWALVAAVGNAFFAAGQKKAVVVDNPYAFMGLAVSICLILTFSVTPLFGQTSYGHLVKQDGIWALVSGAGLFVALLGFNLLYSRYGASNYILYAVLSIITTSIIVGVFVFKESFNIYHWLAFGASILTIVLFTFANSLEP